MTAGVGCLREVRFVGTTALDVVCFRGARFLGSGFCFVSLVGVVAFRATGDFFSTDCFRF